MKSLKTILQKNLSNLPGWRTERKIVVLESDDWGSIRMSSREAFSKLKEAKIPVQEDHYTVNDGLESNSDLELLMEVLSRHKDGTNRCPVITGVNIMGNPDFDKIRESNYQEYHYETFVDTCEKYEDHDRVFDLWKEGISERLMIPVFHGREHLNVQRWMRALQEGCRSTHLAFENGVTGIMQGVDGIPLKNYQAAFDIDRIEDVEYQKEVIRTGTGLFENLFGFQAHFFIPTNGPFNNKLENSCINSGIKYMGTGKIQKEPLGDGKYKRHFRYLGKRNRNGLLYLTRNAFFEPSSQKSSHKDWVNDCLKDIEIAFKWNKPATISTHRVNYIGWLNPNNRSHGLKNLDRLLKAIIRYWPKVEFLTSQELGDTILKSKTAD